MLSKRGTERLAGAFAVSAAVALLMTIITIVPVDLESRAGVRESLPDLVDDEARHFISWSFNMVAGLLTIAVGAGFYLVFRAKERSLALFGAFWLLAAGVALTVATMSYFALFDLADDFVTASGLAEADAALSSAMGFGVVGYLAYQTGLTLLGLGLIPVGVLIAWSAPVPRWLGWLGVAGGVVILFMWFLIGGDDLEVIGIVAGIAGGAAILLFLLILGWWLILGGTREPSTSEPPGEIATDQ